MKPIDVVKLGGSMATAAVSVVLVWLWVDSYFMSKEEFIKADPLSRQEFIKTNLDARIHTDELYLSNLYSKAENGIKLTATEKRNLTNITASIKRMTDKRDDMSGL